jgi:very-short-patch-repair endonuclease
VNRSLARRRALRRNSTDAEVILWRHLRGRRFSRWKFRRQHPCGPYILDFYCASQRLAVELDGGQHFNPTAEAYDERRAAFLRRRRITVLRFPNDLIFRDQLPVLEAIWLALGGPDQGTGVPVARESAATATFRSKTDCR